MAFCKECGTDLGDANFCPKCGASASGEVAVKQPVSAAPDMADVRQRSMHDMEQMLTYFSAKQAQYDEFELVTAEIEERSARTYMGWIIAAVVCVLIAIFSGGIFFFFAAAGFVALFVFMMKKNKERIKIAATRQEELGNELSAYYTDYGYCPVGFEYTKPSTLNAIYDMIRRGRATIPSDAINLYLNDLHNAEMERQAQIQTEAAIATAENTRQAAKSARKAARYSSANFWFK